jgi:hypothetical protein
MHPYPGLLVSNSVEYELVVIISMHPLPNCLCQLFKLGTVHSKLHMKK